MSQRSKHTTISMVLLAVVALGMSGSAAQADTILFNPTGGATTGGGFSPGTFSINALNWGAGDALALGALANGPLTAGGTFQLYVQLKLAALNLSGGGGAVTPAGLNVANGYQITEVTSLTEHVDNVTGNAATFSLNAVQNAPSGMKIYFQDLTAAGAVPTNFNAGTGFNAAATGKVIYAASFTSVQSNYTDTTKSNPVANPIVPLNPTGTNYVGTTTNQGVGGLTIVTRTTSIDPTFFVTPGILADNFTSNLNNPFSQIPASIKFNDPTAALGAGATGPSPSVGSNNGTSGPDFLFQVSGGAESFAIPEPASITMALTAMGLVPLTAWQVRRRRARA
jgi:hypothetical protein